MGFQAVPDTVAIDIIYSMNGETVQNVFYAELPGGYLLADLSALANVIDAQVQGTWKAQQVVEALYTRVEVRGLAVLNDFVATNSTNAGPGVAAGGAMPNNVTLAVKKSSGLTGRSARGRCYWIGVPNSQLLLANENELEPAYVDAVVVAVDSIRSSIDSTPLWVPVLVSRFTAGAERPEGVTFPWISSVAVDTRTDSQRNRLP
jgi:hypothetical protein